MPDATVTQAVKTLQYGIVSVGQTWSSTMELFRFYTAGGEGFPEEVTPAGKTHPSYCEP